MQDKIELMLDKIESMLDKVELMLQSLCVHHKYARDCHVTLLETMWILTHSIVVLTAARPIPHLMYL